MKRLSILEAGDLNFYAKWVNFEDSNEQNFLHLFHSYKDVQALKLLQFSTPKSLLAFTVFNCSLHILEMSDNRIIKDHKLLDNGSIRSDIDILNKAFTKLPNLTSLDISDNGFGEHTPLLILSISRTLKVLNLSKNEIGKHGVALANALTSLTNLTNLDLADNNLNSPTLKILQTYPLVLPKLKFLDIRKNFDTKTTEFLDTLKVFEDHNRTVSEPLFKSFCEFLFIHPEIDPNVASDIVGDHHDHTITLHHD